MKEWIFSGYCRTLDQSRMVEVEQIDDRLEADCCYGSCPYASSCTIAQRIRELEQAGKEA